MKKLELLKNMKLILDTDDLSRSADWRPVSREAGSVTWANGLAVWSNSI